MILSEVDSKLKIKKKLIQNFPNFNENENYTIIQAILIIKKQNN